MQRNIIKYYTKITNLALTNIKDGKRFNMKSKLNNKVMLMQSEDHLIKVYKSAGGGILSDEAKKQIEDYKNSMGKMHELAVKDYNSKLNLIKNAQSIEDKQKILDNLAKRGFNGFVSKDGKHWNVETYSNMYFTHLNNEMVRLGMMDYLKSKDIDKIKISSHGTKCHLCKPYEGVEMLMSELESARNNGLFHPNCKHIILEV